MSKRSAFTIIELVTLVGTISIISLLSVIAATDQGRQSQRAACVNNLRQVSQTFRSWAYDHQNRFPWDIAPVLGTRTRGGAWEHFAVMSNDLPALKILVCPSDKDREPSTHYGTTSGGFSMTTARNKSLSYFVSMHTVLDNPKSFLNGDRNFSGGAAGVGCQKLGVANAYAVNPYYGLVSRMNWTNRIHGADAGNLSFGDGSVLMSNNRTFNQTIADQVSDQNYHWLPPN